MTIASRGSRLLATAILCAGATSAQSELIGFSASGPEVDVTATFDTDGGLTSAGLVDFEAVGPGLSFAYNPSTDTVSLNQLIIPPATGGAGATALTLRVNRPGFGYIYTQLDSRNSATAFIPDLLFDSVGDLLSGIEDHLPVSADNFTDFPGTGLAVNTLTPNREFTSISFSQVPEPAAALLATVLAAASLTTARRRNKC